RRSPADAAGDTGRTGTGRNPCEGRSKTRLRPFAVPAGRLERPFPGRRLRSRPSRAEAAPPGSGHRTSEERLLSTVMDREVDEQPRTTARRRHALLVGSPHGRRLTLPAALVLALASGGLAVLAFPPYGWWPLAAVSVAGLGLAVHRRRPRGGLGLGFVYGLAFFLPLLAWSSTQVGQWPWLFLS